MKSVETTTSLAIEFEKAIRMLVVQLPSSENDTRKPILFHDLRVGIYLYQKGYPRNVILAGVLHDIIEWSDFTVEALRAEFGDDILHMVLANSKDRSIPNSDERVDDMMRRCVEAGQEALIVKAADTIDSFEYYTKTNNKEELLGHCMKNADALLKNLPGDYTDSIFNELKAWRDSTSALYH